MNLDMYYWIKVKIMYCNLILKIKIYQQYHINKLKNQQLTILIYIMINIYIILII